MHSQLGMASHRLVSELRGINPSEEARREVEIWTEDSSALLFLINKATSPSSNVPEEIWIGESSKTVIDYIFQNEKRTVGLEQIGVLYEVSPEGVYSRVKTLKDNATANSIGDKIREYFLVRNRGNDKYAVQIWSTPNHCNGIFNASASCIEDFAA